MSVAQVPEALPSGVDEKKMETEFDAENNDFGFEDGHMQELEVDMDEILKEDGEEDIDGDHSPYAEGISSIKCFSQPPSTEILPANEINSSGSRS